MSVVSSVKMDGSVEVVYRRLTIEMAGERLRQISESGSASTMAALFSRTAARHGTSAAALERSVRSVDSADRVLSLLLPAGNGGAIDDE